MAVQKKAKMTVSELAQLKEVQMRKNGMVEIIEAQQVIGAATRMLEENFWGKITARLKLSPKEHPAHTDVKSGYIYWEE